MRILITGGTGLIGRALCPMLMKCGHQLTVLSRRPRKVAALCGAGVQPIASLDEWTPQRRFDAVVNLAGAPIVGRRWTAGRKQVLLESRAGLTRALVERMREAEVKPEVLISGSAVGFYGDTGDARVTEDQPDAQAVAKDFGAQLCRKWEREAQSAEGLGIRVCLIRTGLVLSGAGGMLARMLPAFRLGLGARIGGGGQWMSWIHVDDEVRAIVHLLGSAASRGAYNLTAPAPVTNTGFSRTLARRLRRPLLFAAPAFALRVMLGEAAGLLLGGQYALPKRLESEGFRFQYVRLDDALGELLG